MKNMDLTKWRQGYDLYLNNAIRLRDDGVLLLEHNSYGHAYFSFYTAMEELGVAMYILHHYSEPNLKEFKKFYKSHNKKSPLMIFDLFGSELENIQIPKDFYKKTFPEEDSMETEYGHILSKNLNIWNKRNQGIYCSLTKDGKNWITPNGIAFEDVKKFQKRLNKNIESYLRAKETLKRSWKK